MKRMFMIIAACGLAACAAQPQRAAVAENALPEAANPDSSAVAASATQASKRVYLDDYDLLHTKASPSKRKAMVLGSGTQ